MFTGIVEELGEVVGIDDLGDSVRLILRGPTVTSDARHGDSIAVNGVCLTVVDVLGDGRFSADVAATLVSALPGCGQPIVTDLGPVLGVHLGAGAVGVVVALEA